MRALCGKALKSALYDLVPRSKLILYECLQIEQITMNRRKKGNQILKARVKKAKAKLSPDSKSKYISKADREKLAADSTQGTTVCSGQ